MFGHYERWVANIDEEQLQAVTNRKTWLFILSTFVALISIGAWAPGISAFFKLLPLPPFIALGVVAVFAYLVSSTKLRYGLGPNRYALLMLAVSAVFQSFMWSLVCFSAFPGATLLAVLPILLAAYHGEFFQFSAGQLWGGLTTIVAIVVALLMANTSDHYAVVVFGGLISLSAAYTMGTYARKRAAAVRERESMREAIEAQTLMERVRETEDTRNLLSEICGANHDAANALSSVLINVDMLQEMLEGQSFEGGLSNDIQHITSDISDSTRKLKVLIDQGREKGKEASLKELVDIDRIAEKIVALSKNQFLGSVSEINYQRDTEIRYVNLHGGESTLERVLLNAVKNACEGNGREHANSVLLHVQDDGQHLKLCVDDDGPGFPAEFLANSASVFTTKEDGTGLGIYTSKRLVAANKGDLSLENLPGRGARVTIKIPVGE